MKKPGFNLLIFAAIILLLISMNACMHDPVFMEDDDGGMPIDTMMIDTMPVDTMNPVDTTTPCDPNLIYFNTEVLPILKANCAQSGCHNSVTAQDGIVLENYADLISSDVVRPFDLGDSDLFEVLTESDPDDRMPPPPANRLASDQINIIAEWILQGADNLMCESDTSSGGCDTDNVSYTIDLVPVINIGCRSCHSGATPAGGIDLSTHSGVQNVGLNGRLIGAIDHQSGFSAMPQGGEKLDVCTIDKFKAWVAAGAPNN